MPAQLSQSLAKPPRLPKLFRDYREKVDRELSRITASSPFQEKLRYHLGLNGQGGKRLRPILCLITYQGLGGELEKALPAAVALELVHNFSLVHDDIQDEDRFRHHRPTLWTLWGKGKAFNLGWLLWLLAINSLQELRLQRFSEEVVFKAEMLLQESCLQMIEGQFLDISFEGRGDITPEIYLKMVEKKTGSLFSASLKMAGLLAFVDDQTLERLEECGRKLGLAFQIKDDLLGIWGREEKTGKPAQDLRKKKKSLPIVYLLEKDKSLSAIYQKPQLTEEDINLVLKLLAEAGAEDFSQKELDHYLQEFEQEIQRIGFSPRAKGELEEIGQFLRKRDY